MHWVSGSPPLGRTDMTDAESRGQVGQTNADAARCFYCCKLKCLPPSNLKTVYCALGEAGVACGLGPPIFNKINIF